VTGYVPPIILEEFALMSTMTDAQRLLFQQQLATVRKDGTTGVILALLLGGLGIHHFYMGNMLAGIVYVLFCWTFIPMVLGLIEAFLMPSRVRDYNRRQANLIAAQIKVYAPAPPA
jgi:TM2 domain-containing membrane protein YozV